MEQVASRIEEERKTNQKKKLRSREFVEDSSDDLWISLSELKLDIPDTSVTELVPLLEASFGDGSIGSGEENRGWT